MKLSDVRLINYDEHPNHEKRTTLIRPPELSPFLIYLILKDLFGEPNSSYDETKTQWGYELRVPGAILDICDWKITSWSIGVYAETGNIDDGERIGREFIDLLKKQSSKYTSRVKDATSQAKTFLMQNPFALYYQSAQNIMEHLFGRGDQAEDNTISVALDPEWVSDLCRSTFFLFIASFEGLMNLIYELYLKAELRDERIYDRLSREQIDIKVRLAPIYCECFRSDLIQHESEVFKRFHSIINIRNDFIHANLTKTMKNPVINEDDCLFIIENSTRDKSGLPKSINSLTSDDLLTIEKSMEEMIDLLVENMKPRYRREFKSIMYNEAVLIEVEDSEIVVIRLDGD
jgi:hypothetical protein